MSKGASNLAFWCTPKCTLVKFAVEMNAIELNRGSEPLLMFDAINLRVCACSHSHVS